MRFFPAKFFDNWYNDLAIDLGTANTVIYAKSRGIVLDQPSVVAIKKHSGDVIAAGQKAKEMLGKTPEGIFACRPLKDGVISDFHATESMLRSFILKANVGKRSFLKPRMVICVPSGINHVEQRAVRDSALQAGAGQAFTIAEPMAAAIGAGMPVEQAAANMIVDIGGGTTEVAIISLSDIVYCRSVRVAGDAIDLAIVDYIKEKHGLLIGQTAAEKVKIEVGCQEKKAEPEQVELKGQELKSGVPKTLKIDSSEIIQAMSQPVGKIVEAVLQGLESCPPELSGDLIDRGIVLAGGGSRLVGLDELITKKTGIKTKVASHPLLCVVQGAGRVIDNFQELKSTLMSF